MQVTLGEMAHSTPLQDDWPAHYYHFEIEVPVRCRPDQLPPRILAVLSHCALFTAFPLQAVGTFFTRFSSCILAQMECCAWADAVRCAGRSDQSAASDVHHGHQRRGSSCKHFTRSSEART